MSTVCPPKVSILIPTYNYADYLATALDSILAQDFADFEVIVSDDASTDDTQTVVEPYLRDARIRYIRQPMNLGMVENWNWCLRQARGEYIKYLFADDALACPDALSSLLTLFDTNPDAGLVTSARLLVDESGTLLAIGKGLPREGVWRGETVIRRCFFLDQNLLGEPTAVMLRKSLMTRGFLTEYRQLVDLEMWLHVCLHGKVVYTDRALCQFRTHAKQQTAQNRSTNKTRSENCKLFLLHYPFLRSCARGWFERAQNRFMLVYYINRLRKLKDPTEAELEIKRALEAGIPLGYTALYWTNYRFGRILSNLLRLAHKCRRGMRQFCVFSKKPVESTVA